jgi:imidazolonepropionase-like amidohydrolase
LHRTVVNAAEVSRALDIDHFSDKLGALEVMGTADLMLVDAGPRHLIQKVADPNHNSRVTKKDGVIDKNTLQLTRGWEPPQSVIPWR